MNHFEEIPFRAAPASRSERSVLGLGWPGKSPSIDPDTKKKTFV